MAWIELDRNSGPASDLPPGLYVGVPHGAYHERRLGIVSKSALDLVDRSPAHYRAWIDGAIDEETPALAFGSAFHCALLEPDLFAESYAVEPEWGDCRLKANKAARDAWRAQRPGAIAVSADDGDAISAMVASVQAHPLASRMLRAGAAEATLVWIDEESGLKCKSRTDYYVPKLGMVADVKTTLDARPHKFQRSIVKHRYHVQDALYRSGFAAIGETVKHFVFIAVEKAPPYAVAIYSVDADGIGRGYSAARRNIDTLAECLRLGAWPGYATSIQTLDIPPWAA